jgi:hypothetical protein
MACKVIQLNSASFNAEETTEIELFAGSKPANAELTMSFGVLWIGK